MASAPQQLWTGPQAAALLTSQDRLITKGKFFQCTPHLTSFKEHSEPSACRDFNCTFTFSRKHCKTIGYSQLILPQALQNPHSGESRSSALLLWEGARHSHASEPGEREESTPYSTRTARTAGQQRGRG